MRRLPHPRQGAFTLLEIMVAMAIFGLIVAAIYSGWMAIMRGSVSASKATAAVQRERVAVRTIEEALTCARSFAADIQYYSFVYDKDSSTLSFVASVPDSFPRSGRFGKFNVRRLTFSVEPGPEYGKQLVLRQNPILMEWDVDEKEHPVILANDVKDFSVTFWDPHANPPDWVEEWTQTNQMPSLVMFTLETGSDPLHPAQGRQSITRVVALPAVTVQAAWQATGVQPGQPGQFNQGAPGGPGTLYNPGGAGNPGTPYYPGGGMRTPRQNQ